MRESLGRKETTALTIPAFFEYGYKNFSDSRIMLVDLFSPSLSGEGIINEWKTTMARGETLFPFKLSFYEFPLIDLAVKIL